MLHRAILTLLATGGLSAAQFLVTLEPDANRTGIAIRIDSARGSTSNPHAPEVLDFRSFVGTSLHGTYADSGRAIAWRDPGPDIAFGTIGARLPLRSLLHPLFPALPSGALQAGDTWERTWTQTAIHGQQSRRMPLRTRYTVESVATVAGSRLARVRLVSTPVSGALPGAAIRGTLTVDGDGIVQELRLEEARTGDDWELNGRRVRYTQRDELTVTVRAGAASSR